MQQDILFGTDKSKPADIFVLGFFEEEKLSKEWEAFSLSFYEAFSKVLSNKKFKGTYAEQFPLYVSDSSFGEQILVFGLGKRKNHKPGCFRKAIGRITAFAASQKANSVKLAVETFLSKEVDLEAAVSISGQLPTLALYKFDKYKQKKEENKEVKPSTFNLWISKKQQEKTLQSLLEQGQAVARGICMTRDLINEPANIMTASRMAEIAKDLSEDKNLALKIINEKEMKRLKMGGILAVNQGSLNEPALIILEHGKQHASKGTICLVGKGVTFDTGGISIKPAKDMEKMKYDMSGAACVISTMGVISDLKLPLHVVALAPCVENNVSANPQRPGDIITMLNGKTVEVLNTDAEGRLILADALSYSKEYNPKFIIDLATLTGMCAYTFGDKAIGLMGNSDKFLNKIKKAGQDSGERCWELPLWDEYGDQIKGHHSDLYNIGGPYGGTITAAMFLKEFLPSADVQWAHLDIAGTAWCDSPRYDCVKGGTGVGVHLLTKLLLNWK